MRLLTLLLTVACAPPTPTEPVACVPSQELCDGLDNDCDGAVDEGLGDRFYRDADQDGYGNLSAPLLTCTAPDGWIAQAGDCNDGDPLVLPGGSERCNGVDDDCNGLVDDQPSDGTPFFVDADGDGFGSPDVQQLACAVGPGLTLEGDDCDDADPLVGLPAVRFFADLDGDGHAGAETVFDCPGAAGFVATTDCDDTNPAIHPDAEEVVADGIDQTCDGLEACYIDADLDGFGTANTTLVVDLQCAVSGTSGLANDCDDLLEAVNPAADERCANGIDDDCNPSTEDVPAPTGPLVYTDVSGSAGLSAPQSNGTLPCPSSGRTGSAAIADVDADGDLDVFLPRLGLPDRLMLNDGDGIFTDVSVAWGLTHTGASNGAVFFDVESDGDLDLFVLGSGTDGNRLYIQEALSFTEQAAARGLASSAVGCSDALSASAADVDGDGDLDLHLTAWVAPGQPSNDLDRLYLNDGTGLFTVDAALTLPSSLNVCWIDADDDGDLDVWSANDDGASTLHANDGALLFTDLAPSLGEAHATGITVGDVDDDGLLQPLLFGADTRLFSSNGPNYVLSTPAAFGNEPSRGGALFDADNDGDLDVALATPTVTRLYTADPAFTEATCSAGFAVDTATQTLLPFDADRDGDLDVLLVSHADAPVLLQANGTGPGLTLALRQPGLNPHAVGSVIWLETAQGTTQRRDIHLNAVGAGTLPAEAHFAPPAGFLSVHVRWPDGEEQVFTNVVAGHTVLTRLP